MPGSQLAPWPHLGNRHGPLGLCLEDRELPELSPEGQRGGAPGREPRCRKDLGGQGPGAAGLPESGQCSLSELGGGEPAVTHAGATGTDMRGHGGHAEGCSSMSSTPRGPGWAPGPPGRTHPVLPPLHAPDRHCPPQHVCLAPSWRPACLYLSSGVRSSAAPLPPSFYQRRLKGKLLQACPLCRGSLPWLSWALDQAQGDSLPFKTLLDVTSVKKPARPPQELGWGSPCHLSSSNSILLAPKAGAGPVHHQCWGGHRKEGGVDEGWMPALLAQVQGHGSSALCLLSLPRLGRETLSC